jgi:hypothetical protein
LSTRNSRSQQLSVSSWGQLNGCQNSWAGERTYKTQLNSTTVSFFSLFSWMKKKFANFSSFFPFQLRAHTCLHVHTGLTSSWCYICMSWMSFYFLYFKYFLLNALTFCMHWMKHLPYPLIFCVYIGTFQGRHACNRIMHLSKYKSGQSGLILSLAVSP